MNAVTSLTVESWAELAGLKMDGWLWLDMTEGGLHRGASLPAEQPSQVSHAWGWSATELVRLRFDKDLPRGMAGASVDAADAGSGELVTVWGNRSGKIRMPGSSEFHDEGGAPSVTLRQYVVHVASTGHARTRVPLTRVPLTFYRLGVGDA